MKKFLRVILGFAVTGLALWIVDATVIIRTTRQLEVGLVSPCAALAALWALFFTRHKSDNRRPSAWLALIFTSLSALAALWACTHLNELSKRSMMDMTYESWATAVAAMGWLGGLVWLVRSPSICAVGTMLAAFWLFFIFSLSY